MDAEAVRREMLRLGVRVAGGQGKLKGRIFRISHMGVDPIDTVVAISALEVALKNLGRDVKLGTAVGAYLEAVSGLL